MKTKNFNIKYLPSKRETLSKCIFEHEKKKNVPSVKQIKTLTSHTSWCHRPKKIFASIISKLTKKVLQQFLISNIHS